MDVCIISKAKDKFLRFAKFNHNPANRRWPFHASLHSDLINQLVEKSLLYVLRGHECTTEHIKSRTRLYIRMYKTMFRCFGNGLELEGFCIILGARSLYAGQRKIRYCMNISVSCHKYDIRRSVQHLATVCELCINLWNNLNLTFIPISSKSMSVY